MTCAIARQRGATIRGVDDPITASGAAKVLGVSGTQVRRLLGAGQLPGIRTPLGWLLERADVKLRAANPPRGGRQPQNSRPPDPEGTGPVRVWITQPATVRAGGAGGLLIAYYEVGRVYALSAQRAAMLVDSGRGRILARPVGVVALY